MKKIIVVLAISTVLNGFSQTSDSFIGLIKKYTSPKSNIEKPSSIINLKDSSYHFVWNASTNDWWPTEREVYGYNVFNKENSSNSAFLSGNYWQQSHRITNYIFDSNNNLLSQIYENWNGSIWVNGAKKSYTYDAFDNNLTATHQVWDATTSIWKNSTNTIKTYDASNNNLTTVYQTWDTGTLIWKNTTKYSYTYDSNNNQLTSLTQMWDATISSWINQNKDTATYNTNNQGINYISQSWNSLSSTWENAGRLMNLVYTNGDLISWEYQTWNTSTLVYEPALNLVSVFDSNHHALNETFQTWVSLTNSWENWNKSGYTFDSNENQLTRFSQDWNTTTNSWENVDQLYNYYSSVVGLQEFKNKQQDFIIYPNPTNSTISIISTTEHINEINITDISGNIVFLEKTDPQSFRKIDVGFLQSGIYFVKVKTINGELYKKFIKN
jgi:hypothetical protein